MSIMVMSRGGTLQGVLLLLTSMIVAPLFVLCAPFVSSLLGLAGAGAAVASMDQSSRAVTPITEYAPSASLASPHLVSTDFARTTFESLALGDTSVADKIDWPIFISLGEDLGAPYSAFDSSEKRKEFVTSYITQFSKSFKESGGSLVNFTNWRINHNDVHGSEVAADALSGTLKISVTMRGNVERVTSINIVK